MSSGRTTAPDGVAIWWHLDGDGPPVLLVPGRGDSSDVWPPDLSDALVAAGCAVLRVDPRETGLSDDGGNDYTFTTMADDLAMVVSAARLPAVHVLALSMGAMITLDLALRHRPLVSSLVLLGPMSPDPDAGIGPRFFEGIAADPVVGSLASMGAPDADDEAWMRARVTTARSRAPTRPDAARRHSDAALRLGWVTVDDLASVPAPTLVIHGGADLVLPLAHAEALAVGIPGSRLHVVDGMGHLPTRREWRTVADLAAGHVLGVTAH